jgi:hypothetical protein
MFDVAADLAVETIRCTSSTRRGSVSSRPSPAGNRSHGGEAAQLDVDTRVTLQRSIAEGDGFDRRLSFFLHAVAD